MIMQGMAAAFDLKLLVTVLCVLYGALATACHFGIGKPSGQAAVAGQSIPGIGGGG